MKPVLDEVTQKIVMSLSGTAREFYDREFSFFDEVTSISGKLKPYIKKTKPEKKVRFLTIPEAHRMCTNGLTGKN